MKKFLDSVKKYYAMNYNPKKNWKWMLVELACIVVIVSLLCKIF